MTGFKKQDNKATYFTSESGCMDVYTFLSGAEIEITSSTFFSNSLFTECLGQVIIVITIYDMAFDLSISILSEIESFDSKRRFLELSFINRYLYSRINLMT